VRIKDKTTIGRGKANQPEESKKKKEEKKERTYMGRVVILVVFKERVS